MKLYTYWRSSAAHRVRIALCLKGVAVEMEPVHLVRDGGEQHAPDYARLNPMRSVPTLVLDDGTAITQSLAAIEWLDERFPDPPLLPDDPTARARARSLALLVATDIHPLNNLRVGSRLRAEAGFGEDAWTSWMRHWMANGLLAYQAQIDRDRAFSIGDRPSVADICLVPQLYNARRWGLDLKPLGSLLAIEARCLALDAFRDAAPERQPDAA